MFSFLYIYVIILKRIKKDINKYEIKEDIDRCEKVHVNYISLVLYLRCDITKNPRN